MTPDSINSTIRRAVPSDAENIAVLYRQLVDSSVNVLPERLAQIANDGNTALLRVGQRKDTQCSWTMFAVFDNYTSFPLSNYCSTPR